MAESVDATVSNTVGAIHPGSIPGPGTETADNQAIISRHFFSEVYYLFRVNKGSVAKPG